MIPSGGTGSQALGGAGALLSAGSIANALLSNATPQAKAFGAGMGTIGLGSGLAKLFPDAAKTATSFLPSVVSNVGGPTLQALGAIPVASRSGMGNVMTMASTLAGLYFNPLTAGMAMFAPMMANFMDFLSEDQSPSKTSHFNPLESLWNVEGWTNTRTGEFRLGGEPSPGPDWQRDVMANPILSGKGVEHIPGEDFTGSGYEPTLIPAVLPNPFYNWNLPDKGAIDDNPYGPMWRWVEPPPKTEKPSYPGQPGIFKPVWNPRGGGWSLQGEGLSLPSYTAMVLRNVVANPTGDVKAGAAKSLTEAGMDPAQALAEIQNAIDSAALYATWGPAGPPPPNPPPGYKYVGREPNGTPVYTMDWSI